MKRCRHRDGGDRIVRWWPQSPASEDAFDVNVCFLCGAWLTLGPSNDVGCEVEIRAAALYAGYETVNDTDDVIDDPITRNCIEHMLGMQDLKSAAARDVFALYEAIRETVQQ